MADIYSKEKRSAIMSKISGNETKIEIIVRKFLFDNGLRYRKNVKTLPGKPDIVLSKFKTVIFVNGCFWHNHESCKKSALPASNKMFWKERIDRNVERDFENKINLEKLGFKVITIWQCELTAKNREENLNKLIQLIFS